MRTGGATAGPQRYPASRPGVEYVIRDAFTRAMAYRTAWQDFEKRKKAGEDAVAPRRDLQLEPLVEVMEGQRLAHVHAYRSDEMLMALRLAEEFGFKVATFEHGLEGYKIAKELAAHGAGVGTFSDWWAYKVEAIDAIPYNAALMMRAGVVVSINSDSAEHARRLNTEAAKMMHWGGLTEDEALALVTINPARQLRVDRRVGSIEAGKDADLVVWSRHPLSSYAVVERTYIDGALRYDRQADLDRVAQVEREKAALVAAEREGRDRAAPGATPAAAAGPLLSRRRQPRLHHRRRRTAQSPSSREPASAGLESRSASDSRTPGPKDDRGRQGLRPARHHQRDDLPDREAANRARDDRDPRRAHRSRRRRSGRAARREGHRRVRRRRLPGVDQRQDQHRPGRAGSARLRGHRPRCSTTTRSCGRWSPTTTTASRSRSRAPTA